MRFILFLAILWTSGLCKGRILMLAPMSKTIMLAEQSLTSNLTDMDTRYLEVSDNTTSKDIEVAVNKFKPNAIVLFDNKSIRAYKQYLARYREAESLPVIGLMALQVETALEGIPKHMGISYDIPAVTTISRLRSLIQNPVKKVGVVYRESMQSFYGDHKRLCEIEHIQLIGYKIRDEENLIGELKRGLDLLVRESEVDAIWIVNDNVLFTPKLFQEVWSPFMRNNRIPSIVGVETLVQPKLQFGTLAVLPDPIGLGAQAANLIYEMEENQWRIEKNRVDKPLSVIQIWNSSMGEKVAQPRPDIEKLVDKVLQ